MADNNSETVKVEFKGKTRHLVSNYANRGEWLGGSDAVSDALEREKTNVVLESEEEIDELQRILEEIKDDPDYNGHMETYNRRVQARLESKRAYFW